MVVALKLVSERAKQESEMGEWVTQMRHLVLADVATFGFMMCNHETWCRSKEPCRDGDRRIPSLFHFEEEEEAWSNSYKTYGI